jgi:hypothetical protein
MNPCVPLGEGHVFPVDDLKRHTPSKDCWCRPEQDDEYLGIWVHRSADGRESYEAGRKMH